MQNLKPRFELGIFSLQVKYVATAPLQLIYYMIILLLLLFHFVSIHSPKISSYNSSLDTSTQIQKYYHTADCQGDLMALVVRLIISNNWINMSVSNGGQHEVINKSFPFDPFQLTCADYKQLFPHPKNSNWIQGSI